jgi:hypothetical protein
MKLKDPLPWQVGLITRIVGWGFGGLLIVVVASGYGRFKLGTHLEDCLGQPRNEGGPTAALLAAQSVAACLDRASGWEKIFVFRARKILESLPNAPCRYVGVWTANRGDVSYTVTLGSDSSFRAEPGKNAPPGAETVTGSWGVSGKRMVWLYDNGLMWPPDVNPIDEESGDAFTLEEMNGTQTRYTKLSGSFQRCK